MRSCDEVCEWKITGLSVKSINACGMGYMSGNEMSPHEEAETVFRVVKKMFIDMQKIEYDSVKRMVGQLRVCMDLLYWKDRYVKGTWSAKMDWWTNAKYYMEIVTGRLNECYAVYEAENSCDLPFDLYVGFLGLLDQCRSWMRKLIEKEPGWGEEGMELGPVRRVTEEEYEGRGRVAEVEDVVRTGASDGVHAADIQTLLCRLGEMNLERVSKDTLRLEI